MAGNLNSRDASLAALAALVGGEVEGDPEVRVGSVANIPEARADSLVRVDHRRFLAAAEKGPGRALLIGPDVPRAARPALRVANPKLAFAICLERLAGGESHPPPGVHPRAVIHPSATLGERAAILAGVVIGPGARIGDGVVLYPNVNIGRDASVGEGTVIFANVTVYDAVEIGRRVRIHSGTVLGADGFGYVWDGHAHHKIPHRGSVRIGDHAEIGANCCVDRATTGVTEIGPGTKIDNLVQIGHNAQIGPDCMLVAGVMIGGSATLGARCVLGGHAGVRDHVTLGDDVILAGKAGAWSDLAAGGKYSGNPARPHMEETRALADLRRIPDLAKRVRELERRLSELEEMKPPRISEAAPGPREPPGPAGEGGSG